MPHSSAYHTRFGSLLRVYEMVGFKPGRNYRYLEIKQLIRRLHADLIRQLQEKVTQLGGHIRHDTATDLVWINEEFSMSILPVRCMPYRSGSLYWKAQFDATHPPDIFVVVRLDEENLHILDYYLLPGCGHARSYLTISDINRWTMESYRFDNLDYLFGMVERISLGSHE